MVFDDDITVSSDPLLVLDVQNLVVDGAGKKFTAGNPNYFTDYVTNCHGYNFVISGSTVAMINFLIMGNGFPGMCIDNSTVTMNQVSFYDCSTSYYKALNVLNAAVMLSDILFQDYNGTSSAMMVYKGRSVVLKRVQFTSNTDALTVSGTGDDSAPVFMTNIKFTGNSKGLTIYESTVALRYAEFEQNENAMYLGTASSAILNMVSFTGNTGNSYSAIFTGRSSNLTLSSVTFSKNQAGVSTDDNVDYSSSGGVLNPYSGGSVTALDVVFYDNTPNDISTDDQAGLVCKADACTEGTEVVTATGGGNCATCGPCDALRKGFVAMCSSCGAGLFSSRNASLKASCLECGGGNRSFSGTNTSCTLNQCPVGSYGPLDSTACIICQDGYATYTAGLSACTRCQFFEWCPTDGLCIEGHTGVGCSQCDLNWYMKDNMCEQCPESGQTGLAITFVAIVFSLLVLFKLAGAEDEENDDDESSSAKLMKTAVAKFNVTLSFFQISTVIFFSFDFKFPFNLLSWVSWIALPLSFEFGELARPECSMGTSMGVESRWSTNTFTPLLFVLPFALLAKYREEYRSQAIATIALIGTSTYVPVISSAMTLWRCEENDYGHSVLAAAPSVNCDGSGYYYIMLVGSIVVTAAYLCGVHVMIPRLSKIEGFGKVKRIYVQDLSKGRKWWFHVTIGYKLATLLLAEFVLDTLVQLMLMLVLSSSVTLLCFTCRPHIVSGEINSKIKCWNDKCTQGCRSICCQWNFYTKCKWIIIQVMICCVSPAIVFILFYATSDIEMLVMFALWAFLFTFGPLFCALKCYYEHVFADGFTPNSVEGILHAIEALLVAFTVIYQIKSKKLEHPNQQRTDDYFTYYYSSESFESYDANGDYVSNDLGILTVGLTFLYIFGVALSIFEIIRLFEPVQYIKGWLFGEESPVAGLARQVSGLWKKETNSNFQDVKMPPTNPLQGLEGETCEEGFSVKKDAQVELEAEMINLEDIYKNDAHVNHEEKMIKITRNSL